MLVFPHSHRAEITCSILSSCSSTLSKPRSLVCWGEFRSIMLSVVCLALRNVIAKIAVFTLDDLVEFWKYVVTLKYEMEETFSTFFFFFLTGEWISVFQEWMYSGSLGTELVMFAAKRKTLHKPWDAIKTYFYLYILVMDVFEMHCTLTLLATLMQIQHSKSF